MGDAELLKIVGNPFPVTPDQKLQKLAQERGWPSRFETLKNKEKRWRWNKNQEIVI